MQLIRDLIDEEDKTESVGGCAGSDNTWRINVVIATTSLILYIIGFSTPYWAVFYDQKHDHALDNPIFIHLDIVKVDRSIGLWVKCSAHKITGGCCGDLVWEVCESMDNKEDWKPASKILCTLGLCLFIVGYCITLSMCCEDNRSMLGLSGCLFILGSLTGSIGGIAFLGNSRDSDYRLYPHYSAFFFLISCTFFLISGCIQVLANRNGGCNPMA